jgi:hypothetical protein
MRRADAASMWKHVYDEGEIVYSAMVSSVQSFLGRGVLLATTRKWSRRNQVVDKTEKVRNTGIAQLSQLHKKLSAVLEKQCGKVETV